jgi:hypothetical protein
MNGEKEKMEDCMGRREDEKIRLGEEEEEEDLKRKRRVLGREGRKNRKGREEQKRKNRRRGEYSIIYNI